MTNIFTPPEITHEDKLKDFIAGTSTHSNASLQNTKANFEETLRRFWENAEFTPQEQFNYYGNQAYKLFEESNKVIAFIRTYEPEYFPAVNIKPYTINEDGTVTILPDPIIEE